MVSIWMRVEDMCKVYTVNYSNSKSIDDYDQFYLASLALSSIKSKDEIFV